jgi:GxxExxY protein
VPSCLCGENILRGKTVKEYEPISERAEEAARAIVDSAFRVHSALGPGLLEGVYEVCLCRELSKRNILYQSQVVLPVIYDNVTLDAGLRLDFLVEESVVVELKAVEKTLPIHEAQLLTYLKLTGKRLGLLINFNVSLIRHGIKRIVL